MYHCTQPVIACLSVCFSRSISEKQFSPYYPLPTRRVARIERWSCGRESFDLHAVDCSFHRQKVLIARAALREGAGAAQTAASRAALETGPAQNTVSTYTGRRTTRDQTCGTRRYGVLYTLQRLTATLGGGPELLGLRMQLVVVLALGARVAAEEPALKHDKTKAKSVQGVRRA